MRAKHNKEEEEDWTFEYKDRLLILWWIILVNY